MRQLGYPPGWMEEAKLEHSGINLYNSDGRRELDPTEELGEIFIPENKTQYDIKKVHDFPGYNIPAPEGTRDVRKYKKIKKNEYDQKKKLASNIYNFSRRRL